jgi:hypothetical protein
MKTGRVLKLAAYYRLLATVSFVVGFGIVAAGAVLGLGPMLQHMLENAPQDFGESLSRAQPVLFVALTAVGLSVWQFGKSFALVRVISSAIEEAEGEDGLDRSALRSDVAEVVDDRLAAAEIETGAGSTDGVQDRASRRRSATAASGGVAEAETGSDAVAAADSPADAGESAGDAGGTTANSADGTTRTYSDDTEEPGEEFAAAAGDTSPDDGEVTADDWASDESADEDPSDPDSEGETAGGDDDPLAAGSEEADDEEWRPSN